MYRKLWYEALVGCIQVHQLSYPTFFAKLTATFAASLVRLWMQSPEPPMPIGIGTEKPNRLGLWMEHRPVGSPPLTGFRFAYVNGCSVCHTSGSWLMNCAVVGSYHLACIYWNPLLGSLYVSLKISGVVGPLVDTPVVTFPQGSEL